MVPIKKRDVGNKILRSMLVGIYSVGYHPPFSTQRTSPSAIYSSSY